MRDEVLLEYENRPDFTVYPESGAVSYGNWWSVGYCNRVGRNHIAIELRKLYEGTPLYVVEHFHKYAVPEAAAKADLRMYGTRNIGLRQRSWSQRSRLWSRHLRFSLIAYACFTAKLSWAWMLVMCNTEGGGMWTSSNPSGRYLRSPCRTHSS